MRLRGIGDGLDRVDLTVFEGNDQEGVTRSEEFVDLGIIHSNGKFHGNLQRV